MEIRKILEQNWGILQSDTRLIPYITEKPNITARRARNITDILTSSPFQRPPVSLGRGYGWKGSYPCGECTVCPHMLHTCGSHSSRHF
ncbi:hypothetical protein GDO81_016818 [Engystomops pustulosus]|uniref:Uncharacterized protein n=1 Tax=Engystomops pustulosus TaxID=76066 RepID=A0AAV7A8R2_ENGPU|nr:hypothetical protein GDO81_016818 [Engystomops pustulosus]